MGLLTSELLDQHWNEIISNPYKMIRLVVDNFHEHICQRVNNNGKHLIDIIFKTKEN